MRLAFIGAGKMATAISAGLAENGVWARNDMVAADVSPEAREAFTAKTGVACAVSASEIVPEADVVLLAVKPQYAEEAVTPIGSACDGKLIVSIAAGLPLSKLCGWFGTARVVRVMPNTPAMVGKGAAAYAWAEGVSDDDRELVARIFGAVGVVCEVTEDKMDAVTALSGSGPAYIFEMIQALVDGAVAVGIPADMALELAEQTVAGAAEMVRRRLGTPDELRAAVTSRGGTTAAGLAVFADAGFRTIVADVIRAARDRSVELGKG